MNNFARTHWNHPFIYMMGLFVFMLIVSWGVSSQAKAEGKGISQTEATELIRQAADATEQAWEKFHDAAIQGTLASPLVQVTIESQLHEVRRLLMEARKAQRAQDYLSVKTLTQHIQSITQHIVQASRKRKP